MTVPRKDRMKCPRCSKMYYGYVTQEVCYDCLREVVQKYREQKNKG